MKFVVVFSVVVLLVVAVSAEEFRCKEKVAYKENECNSCFCGPDGMLGCTLKHCAPDERTQALYDCQVGTTSEKGCNKCWCVEYMGTICTDNKC